MVRLEESVFAIFVNAPERPRRADASLSESDAILSSSLLLLGERRSAPSYVSAIMASSSADSFSSANETFRSLRRDLDSFTEPSSFSTPSSPTFTVTFGDPPMSFIASFTLSISISINASDAFAFSSGVISPSSPPVAPSPSSGAPISGIGGIGGGAPISPAGGAAGAAAGAAASNACAPFRSIAT